MAGAEAEAEDGRESEAEGVPLTGSPTVGRVFRVAGQWAAGKARWGGNLARHKNVPTYGCVFVSGWREGFGRPPPQYEEHATAGTFFMLDYLWVC